MRRFAAPLILPLACAVLACASASPEIAAADDAIDAAGVRMPRRVGEHVATLVSYGGDPEQGAFLRYEDRDSLALLPRIDVVVYPADLPLSAEIQASHADLLAADDASRQVDHTTLLDDRFAPGADTYRATYYVELRDVPTRSVVWLREIEGRWLKARVSMPFMPGYDPVEEVEDIVEELLDRAS